MLTPKIVIVASGKMFGPFDDQETAQSWLESHSAGKSPELYSVTSRETGTAETAHQCGTRLDSIDESSRTTRSASAA